MESAPFVLFTAFLLFALFNVYWHPKFPYPRFRWIVFILQCVGVLGALWVLVMESMKWM